MKSAGQKHAPQRSIGFKRGRLTGRYEESRYQSNDRSRIIGYARARVGKIIRASRDQIIHRVVRQAAIAYVLLDQVAACGEFLIDVHDPCSRCGLKEGARSARATKAALPRSA